MFLKPSIECNMFHIMTTHHTKLTQNISIKPSRTCKMAYVSYFLQSISLMYPSLAIKSGQPLPRLSLILCRCRCLGSASVSAAAAAYA